MSVRRDSARWRAVRLLVGLLAAAALGQVAARAEGTAASFFIETITVETERLSPDIVLSESLLREGREYSEAELSEAVHRINRLPFVLLAEFSLRKGSERGRYELVIAVSETRRWFFQLGLAYEANDPFDRFQLAGEIDDRFRVEDDDLDALVGRRFAVGRRGLLFASFATEEGLFAVGYQRYNLWDRNILFSITLAGENGGGDASDSSRAVRAQLGIPIRGNHAVRLLAGWNRDDFGIFLGQRVELRKTEAEVAWVFNSLDDPVLPRAGSLFEAGVTWAESDDRRLLRTPEGGLVRVVGKEQEQGLIGTAARHWPVAARQSVSAGIGGFFGDGPAGSRLLEVEASVGHQVFLLRNLEPGRWRELRFESQLSALRQEFSSGDPGFGFPLTLNGLRLRAGLTFRSGWGLFRVVFDYAERDFE